MILRRRRHEKVRVSLTKWYIKCLCLIYEYSLLITHTYFVYKIMICLYTLIILVTAKETEKLTESEKVQLDPKTCQIPVDQEVMIEFQKEKVQVVGIVIAGGSDTLWVSVIFYSILPSKPQYNFAL